MMKYDSDWQYLGMKTLRQEAHWSQGMVFDGEYFYVAYLDTSQRTLPTFFPVYPNVHLAVFDRNWDLVHDRIVTNFTRSDNKMGGRPWVILHGNRLYVSYDVDAVNSTTQEEEAKWQAYVSIYEIMAPTDLNQDGTVNILDISIVAKAFGSKPGDPNWNETADLNKDELVNILDISLVARDFGKTT
jgi:hypothetical protein